MGKDLVRHPDQEQSLPPLAAAVAAGDPSAKRQARLRAESAAQSTRTDAAMREFEEGLKGTRQAEIDFYRQAGLITDVADEDVTDEMLENTRELYRNNPVFSGKQEPTALDQLNVPTAQVRKNLASPPPGGWPKTQADVEGERNLPAGPRAQREVGAAPVARAVGRPPVRTGGRPQPVRDAGVPQLSPPPGGFDLAYPKAKKPLGLKEPGALLDGYKLLYGSMAPKSLRPRVKGGR